MSLEPAASEPHSGRRLMLIDELLSRYGLGRVGEVEPVADSVLSENYRVNTSGGPHFLRLHKKSRTLERIAGEYALLRWAGERGIAVVPPLADPGGKVIHRIEGRFVSLFPWVEGKTIEAASATADDARRLGSVHGRVAAVIAGYESPWLETERQYPRWETEASIAALSRIDDLIRYYPAPPADQLRVQQRIRFQLEHLESPEARPLTDFAGLHRQACFGDFHERQVLFGEDGSLVAVVDWEGLAWAPPSWELLRAVTLSGMLGQELLRAYLGAYREHAPIRGGEAGLAVECWWQTLVHDTWSLTTRFIEGDRRPERFFASEESHLHLFADRSYRSWLAGELRLAAAEG